MKSIYFNELSLINIQYNKNIERSIINVIKFLKSNGINKCKATNDVRTFFINSFSGMSRSLALSFVVSPFYTSNEYDANEDKEYILFSWKYNNKEAIGLSYAHNTGTFTLSFIGNGFDDSQIKINRIVNDELQESIVTNISNDGDFNFILSVINNSKPIELLKSTLSIEQKRKMSSFASDNHHGTNILLKYLDKVLVNPYIEYVINSALLNSCNNNFISYDDKMNALVIRLLFIDTHPGFVVKCTGRNKDECLKIKEILEKDLINKLT